MWWNREGRFSKWAGESRTQDLEIYLDGFWGERSIVLPPMVVETERYARTSSSFFLQESPTPMVPMKAMSGQSIGFISVAILQAFMPKMPTNHRKSISLQPHASVSDITSSRKSSIPSNRDKMWKIFATHRYSTATARLKARAKCWPFLITLFNF